MLAGLLADENLRKKLAEVVPNTISGILTNLASDKFPEIAGSLTPDNNHDLEKALAEAFSRALDDINRSAATHQPESERQDLQSEINRCLPYWQDRIKRGVRSPGSLFPAAISAENFILASGDLEQTEELLRDDVVATLQRWLREEEEHKGHSGSTGEFFNPLLPLIRERMPGLIGKHLNQIVKEDDYKNSWIAFQRAYLQSSRALLKQIGKQNAELAVAVNALSERIDSITVNQPLLERLASGLAQLFSMLEEDEASRERHLIVITGEIRESESRIIDKIEESKLEILKAIPGRISAGPNLHQLPADTSEFTGRTDELDDLLKRVKTSGVTITGLKGMGGIGKTWLAVRLAHELQNDYPEAQIYLDLQGVSRPDDRTGLRRQPLSPEDVMWHVIRSFHPGIERPESFEEHLTLYRECLNGRRVLLVYDNARDEDQIRQLHPPSSCLLIVTSRQSIDLPGMYLKQIDRMKPEESIELIERIAPGRSGDMAGEIATLCGHLPLALNVTASVLKKERMMTPADIVERLRKPSGRLSWKSLQEVETAFSLSYDLLSEDHQRKWRMLAVFSETFDKSAAAAIWDADPDLAAESCSELVDGYSLVDFDEKNARMRLHDLARDFAIDRITDDELSLARSRHSRHYLSVLSLADDQYKSGGENVISGLNLYDAETRNILEGRDWAVGGTVEDSDRARLVIEYSYHGINIILLRLHSSTLVEWHQAAVDAAVRINSKSDEGIARGNLGLAYAALGEVRKAIENYEAALVIAREIGDRRGEGNRLGNLGNAYRNLGEVRKAIENYESSLAIFESIESPNAGIVRKWLDEIKSKKENE